MKELMQLKKANYNLAKEAMVTDILRHSYYINGIAFYSLLFQEIPNVIETTGVNCEKAVKWFVSTYKNEINDSKIKFSNDKKKITPEHVFCVLSEDLMVHFDLEDDEISIMYKDTDYTTVQELAKNFRRFIKKKEKDKPEIMLLVNNNGSLDTHRLEVTKPKLNIDDNYNDDFKETHALILDRLQKQHDKGIVLLHGKPGTGKTNYIRFLASKLKKDVIFLPPNMASAVTNPDLLSVLIDNPNSVFVIEDAENIVVDRERDGYSPVSALLNLSDGLLSDCLNIQLICSFNTDISKIDPALMRKGRLIAKYEFNELETEKAQALSNKLGYSTIIETPQTLAEIYNQEDGTFDNTDKRNTIGFKIVPKPKYKNINDLFK